MNLLPSTLYLMIEHSTKMEHNHQTLSDLPSPEFTLGEATMTKVHSLPYAIDSQ